MDVVIIGAGGHGKVVLDILQTAGRYRVVGFLDADPQRAGTTVDDIEVLGPVNLLNKLRQMKVRGAIVAIGDNRVRRGYMSEIEANGLEAITAVHPAASVSERAVVGRNVCICAGVIVATQATIADSVILNTGCVVDHECVIGEGAHIGPGALLAGRVQVGPEAFVGLGAKVIQCRSIGASAIVGAGAVVIRDVAEKSKVVGVPCRIIS